MESNGKAQEKNDKGLLKKAEKIGGFIGETGTARHDDFIK